MVRQVTPAVSRKMFPGAKEGDEIVGCSFNPVKPVLACVLETGIIAAFCSDSYSKSFSEWNTKIFFAKVELPNSKTIGWNVI